MFWTSEWDSIFRQAILQALLKSPPTRMSFKVHDNIGYKAYTLTLAYGYGSNQDLI